MHTRAARHTPWILPFIQNLIQKNHAVQNVPADDDEDEGEGEEVEVEVEDELEEEVVEEEVVSTSSPYFPHYDLNDTDGEDGDEDGDDDVPVSMPGWAKLQLVDSIDVHMTRYYHGCF